MRKKIIIFLITILLVCFGIFVGLRQIGLISRACYFVIRPMGQVEQKEISVAGNKIQVEIADTDAKREQGLSDRKSLCSSCGTLFVFDTPGVYSFWMRRMYFDIDMIWILGDTVVDITYDAKKPPAEESESPKTIYQPKSPADKVLEVNSGWAKEHDIKTEDTLSF